MRINVPTFSIYVNVFLINSNKTNVIHLFVKSHYAVATVNKREKESWFTFDFEVDHINSLGIK